MNREDAQDGTKQQQNGRHAGRGRWMMVACCIPMVVIAVTLVATGAAGADLPARD